MIQIRPGRPDDEEALARIDAATWTEPSSPAPSPPPGTAFFGPRTAPADILVAEDADAVVVGYARLTKPDALPSHQHVLELNGLAVDVAYRRLGAGRLLVDAVAAEARARGARKLTLRVLGTNGAARTLYESCGFVAEGVLRGEFLVGGRFVDDVLMARYLTDT